MTWTSKSVLCSARRNSSSAAAAAVDRGCVCLFICLFVCLGVEAPGGHELTRGGLGIDRSDPQRSSTASVE